MAEWKIIIHFTCEIVGDVVVILLPRKNQLIRISTQVGSSQIQFHHTVEVIRHARAFIFRDLELTEAFGRSKQFTPPHLKHFSELTWQETAQKRNESQYWPQWCHIERHVSLHVLSSPSSSSSIAPKQSTESLWTSNPNSSTPFNNTLFVANLECRKLLSPAFKHGKEEIFHVSCRKKCEHLIKSNSQRWFSTFLSCWRSRQLECKFSRVSESPAQNLTSRGKKECYYSPTQRSRCWKSIQQELERRCCVMIRNFIFLFFAFSKSSIKCCCARV